MRPLLCAPLRLECLAVRRGARGLPVDVARCGAGQRAKPPAGHDGPRAVLGVAGSVRQDVRPGDVVVASEVRDHHGTVLGCPTAPLLATALRTRGLTVHVGPIVTADRLVVGAPARDRLAASGALAVDLESLQLLQSATGPIAVVRVIVDAPGAALVHPGTVRRGSRALRTLAHVVPAVSEWAAACVARDVVLAEPRAFCAGVERAISTVERSLDLTDGPVFVRRQVVHNAHVVSDLARRGAVFITELDEAPDGATVVLSAHGVAPSVRQDAARRRMQVIDATCPLVAKVHAEARHAAGRGHTIVLIGHGEHEEVVGTVGEAPGQTVVIGSAADVEQLEVPDDSRVTWLGQTTLAVDETDEVIRALQARYPAGQGQAAADVCYATTNRQSAVRAVAAATEVVLVIGSENSSNSKRLVEVASRAGAVAHLLEDASALDPRWLAGVARVGVSAGASAPPVLVEELLRVLRGLGPIRISTAGGGPETVRFDLPKEVRLP